MKFIYPAVFRKTDKGTYKGFFPDLEDCFGEGDNRLKKKRRGISVLHTAIMNIYTLPEIGRAHV